MTVGEYGTLVYMEKLSGQRRVKDSNYIDHNRYNTLPNENHGVPEVSTAQTGRGSDQLHVELVSYLCHFHWNKTTNLVLSRFL